MQKHTRSEKSSKEGRTAFYVIASKAYIRRFDEDQAVLAAASEDTKNKKEKGEAKADKKK